MAINFKHSHGGNTSDKTMSQKEPKKMSVNWMKTGEESAKLHEHEKAAQEKRRQESGKLFRFFLKKDEEARIVFVDGALSPKGYLIPPRFYEHFVNLNGDWMNVICPQQTDPQGGEKCPICEGKDKPSLVSLFTVIDTRKFTTKNGVTIPFTKKLFVAKPSTFEILNKIAVKRGGIAGAVFDVSRVGDKSPAVGSMFDFQEKITPEQGEATFTAKYTDKEGNAKSVNLFVPADYDKEIVYRSGDELRKMGFGAPLGSYNGAQDEAAGTDYSDKM